MKTKIIVNNINYSEFVFSIKETKQFNEFCLIGNTPSAEISITVNNAEKVFNDLLESCFIVKQDNKQIGLFNVIEHPERMTTELNLTLNDNMIKTNIMYNSKINYPCTVRNQLDEMITILNLNIDYSEIPYDMLKKKINFYDNTKSIREHLSWISEMCACNVIADEYGILKFHQLSNIPKHELPSSDVECFEKTYDYKISRIKLDNGLLSLEKGDEQFNTLYINPNNPYIEHQEQIDYLYSILHKVAFTSVKSFKIAAINSLTLGEIVCYNNQFNFMAMNIKTDYLNALYDIQEIGGEMKTKANESVINRDTTDTKIRGIKVISDQNKQSLEIISKEQDGLNEKVGKFELDMNSIKLKVGETETKVEDIANKKMYRSILSKNGSTITPSSKDVTLTCQVFQWDEDITETLPNISFQWMRISDDAGADNTWANAHKGIKSVTITSNDIKVSASFGCAIVGISRVPTVFETIVDETDLEMPTVAMYSNMPPNQLYDPVTKVYHPAWINMKVYPIIRLHGLEMSLTDTLLSIVYKRKDGTESETDLLTGEANEKNVLTIDKNMLATSPSKIITYIVYVTYKGIKLSDSISFTLTTNGSVGDPGANATERYQWIKYADDVNGSGMSDTPEGKKYLGVAYNKTSQTPSTNAKDYAWSLIQGKDAAIQSDTEPTDKTMLWLDTSVSPAVLKHWNGTMWEKPNDNTNDIVDAVEKITTEYNSALNLTKQDINLKVEEVKTITDTQSRLMSSLQNEMELTKDATSFIKTKVEEVANVLDGKVDTVTIKEWARFNGSSLELGASNSIFKAILTNTELGFYQSDTKVAWISNNELQILSANIKQKLTIGKAIIEWSDVYGLTIRM